MIGDRLLVHVVSRASMKLNSAAVSIFSDKYEIDSAKPCHIDRVSVKSQEIYLLIRST